MMGEAVIMIEKYLIYWVMVTVNNSHLSMAGDCHNDREISNLLGNGEGK